MSKMSQITSVLLKSELSHYQAAYHEMFPNSRLIETILSGYTPGLTDSIHSTYKYLLQKDTQNVMSKTRYVLEYVLLQDRVHLPDSAVLRLLTDAEQYTIIRGSLPAYKDKLSLLLLTNIDTRTDEPETARKIIESAVQLKMDRPHRFALTVYAVANIGLTETRKYERLNQVLNFDGMKDEHRMNLAYYFVKSEKTLEHLLSINAKTVLKNIFEHLSFKHYQLKFESLASDAYQPKTDNAKTPAFWVALDYLSANKYKGRYLDSVRPTDTYEIIQRLQQYDELDPKKYGFTVSSLMPYTYSHNVFSSVLDFCTIAKGTTSKNGIYPMNARLNQRVGEEVKYSPIIVNTLADLFGRQGLLVYSLNRHFNAKHWPSLVSQIVQHPQFSTWSKQDGFDHFCRTVHKLLQKPDKDFDISGVADSTLDALNINHVVYNLNISLGRNPLDALIETINSTQVGHSIDNAYDLPELS